MSRIVHYTEQSPPDAGQRLAIRQFVESHMEPATVVMPFAYYEAADCCAVEWIGDDVGGVAFHRVRYVGELSVVHIVGTFVAPGSVRRAFMPMMLQVGIIEQCLRLPNPHWCFRTRNPLASRAVRRYRQALAPADSAATARQIVAACYGTDARLDLATGVLHGSYPVDSRFLAPTIGPRFPEVAYERNECRVFCGPVEIEGALRVIEQLRADRERDRSSQPVL